MKYKEIIKLLETADWYFVRQKGSHKIYRNKKTNKIVVIAGNGNKDIPNGTLNKILKTSGLNKK